jgi:predicted phosphodiesterase
MASTQAHQPAAGTERTAKLSLRYGVISDIHGNLHALDKAIKTLSRAQVDAYLCAGDLVGYGPMPNECVGRIAELGAECVVGNHDLIALGLLSDEGCSELARQTLAWTAEQLDDDSRRYLRELPRLFTTPDGVVMAHGSLSDPSEYIRTPEQSDSQLRELERLEPEARVLLLGHTHRPAAHAHARGTLTVPHRGLMGISPGTRYLLNPGSVGQSREKSARAQFMVLDMARDAARFYAVRYDFRGARRALRERELPSWALRPQPVRWRTWAHAARQHLPGLRR